MIGDGMGLSQISAALIANHNKLHLERCTHVGLMKTFAGDNLITDSAAGATAFSTGKKTYNGAIGVDMDSVSIITILELAEKEGLATGLVATSSITHATPASFIAHQVNRYMYEEIALDFLMTDIDIFIGGGRKYFRFREDQRDLLSELKNKGYSIYNGIEVVAATDTNKQAIFIADDHPKPVKLGRPETYLEDASLLAINRLKREKKGYFLMIEGSQIDWGGHANDSQYIINEMIDFDRAIGKVLDHAAEDGNTLVVITADHETGGYAIGGGSLENATVESFFTSEHHTGTMVPVFSFGPGAENFTGIIDNTDIFFKFKQLLGL
ncbi:MAG: alkaline phosphatase [Bacteroidetes bacterium]|nr:alkaline phosphatase [Bacteroidota bacterium]